MLINELTASYSSSKYKIKFWLFTGAFAIIVLALANLRTEAKTTNELRKGIDIVVALDVSNSMLSGDVKPSRIDKAKQYIRLLLDKLTENRIGLVLFAGDAFLQMPLTSDVGAARLFLANADPSAISLQGTVLSQALLTSNNAFNKEEKKYKAIILISDGEDHDEGTVELATTLREEGVTINTIGVGTEEGGEIPNAEGTDVKKDANGRVIISKLNESVLKEIAAASGGLYKRLENTASSAEALAESLSAMEKKTINASAARKDYRTLFPFFLGLALLILVVELFITERKPGV